MGYFGSGQEMEFKGPVFLKAKQEMEKVKADLNEIDGMDVDEIRGGAIFYATTAESALNHPIKEISRHAYAKFMSKNMLFREFAPGLQKMEQEVKQMAREMIGLPNTIRVNLTGGGSESLYCSINAAYQWAKTHKKSATSPEIIVPYTMHAAVSKWCHYTGIKLKRIPVGKNLRADVTAMEKAITKNTIYIAGSAPCWPYGLYDPIENLAKLALEYNLWMHVDACLGGYQAPFVEKITGVEFPKWRVGQVPGITSMSADIHKHAYSAKPLSSIFFKDKEHQDHHWIHPSDWPDGHYDTEAMMGSFPAGSTASAWAVMKYLGEEGYLGLAKKALETRKRYTQGIEAIQGLKTLDSDLSVLLFTTEEEELDTLAILAGLIQEKCYALPCYQPMAIKVALDPVSDAVIDMFLDTLNKVVAGVRSGEITSDFLLQFM